MLAARGVSGHTATAPGLEPLVREFALGAVAIRHRRVAYQAGSQTWHTFKRLHACMHACIHTCIHAYICISICIYIYIQRARERLIQMYGCTPWHHYNSWGRPFDIRFLAGSRAAS